MDVARELKLVTQETEALFHRIVKMPEFILTGTLETTVDGDTYVIRMKNNTGNGAWEEVVYTTTSATTGSVHTTTGFILPHHSRKIIDLSISDILKKHNFPLRTYTIEHEYQREFGCRVLPFKR